MIETILVINAGSSSIKFSIFDFTLLTVQYRGIITELFETPQITVFDTEHNIQFQKNLTSHGHSPALTALFEWLDTIKNKMTLRCVGHRVVHGGKFFYKPTVITDGVITQLEKLISLAPLHQPHSLKAIQSIQSLHPTLPQIACFDTAFHHTQSPLATHFALPDSFAKEGILRYGFHGISYEYIASAMSKSLGDIANERVIVAHLGNGSSMCAMRAKKSIATTMGFTALEGLMMGTRSGHIDPGVLLYLLQEKQYSTKQIETLLYQQSGLLGVSEISSNMHELLASENPKAKFAIELFCYRAALEAGSLITALQGCDALIFTAGIGENAAIIREKICDYLKYIGLSLNPIANAANENIISDQNSKVIVGIIPTDEEFMIAKHTVEILNYKIKLH